MDDTIHQVKSIDGVQYAITHGSYLRVVFQHNADSDSVKRVSNALGCTGELGATQEHLASVDYPMGQMDK